MRGEGKPGLPHPGPKGVQCEFFGKRLPIPNPPQPGEGA